MKLSVLDQSFCRHPEAATEALQETIAMAKLSEALGYQRFWLSEHHAFPSIAGSAPEVLLAAVGAATQRIRIGSGGVMLPHYSPYKVAEQFALLANLYPQRVDLGLGRAPGADMATAKALAQDGTPRFDRFPQQVSTLSHYLYQPEAKPTVSPAPPADLPIWMLGTSADSALLAAKLGLPYNLGLFINPDASPQLTQLYRQHFQSSPLWPQPYVICTLGVFCAESQHVARSQQRTFDVNFFRFITGRDQGLFLNPNEAANVPDSIELLQFIQHREKSRAVGTPPEVRSKLVDVATAFEADELMLVSNIYDFEERKECLQLVKQACSTAQIPSHAGA